MDCLKVPKSEGENIRQKLLKKDLLFQEGKIKVEGDHIFIPLNKVKSSEIDDLGYEIVEKDIEVRKKTERDYRELVDVPSDLENYVPTSYDVIGDIALIKIPTELQDFKRQIGKAILKTHKNLETVLEDKGVHGELRTRSLEYIAGEDKTETLYREHGAEFELDVEKVYFSPRLATERWRVVNKVKEDESVLDMFAGAGPYTVLIGKNVDVDHIYSIDLNPIAIRYLKKNIERNSIRDLVTTHQGDAGEIAPMLSVDRIIMNLPHSSKEFIEPALCALKKEGTIHYYEIVEDSEKKESIEELLKRIEKEDNFAEILEERVVRTYSASKVHMAYDIFVRKK